MYSAAWNIKNTKGNRLKKFNSYRSNFLSSNHIENISFIRRESFNLSDRLLGISPDCLNILYSRFCKLCDMDNKVNLGLYVNYLRQSQMEYDSKYGIDKLIFERLLKLDHFGSFKEYLTWQELKEKFTGRCSLILPIENQHVDNRDEYYNRLQHFGIPAKRFTDRPFHTKLFYIPNDFDHPMEIVGNRVDHFGIETLKSDLYHEAMELQQHDIVTDDLLMDIDEKIKSKGGIYDKDENTIQARQRIELYTGYRYLECSQDEQRKIQTILNGPPTLEMIIEKFNIPITKEKFICLRSSNWLNDEIVNFYMNLLMDRDMTLHSKDDHHQRSHFFNSFFIEKLFHSNKEYHYQNVQRWTKKFDIFSMKRIFFPINISNTHWTLAVIHMNKKRIDYYDSMSGSGRLYVTGLLRWLKDEAKAKKNMDLNVSEWTVHDGNDIIQLGQAHSDDELIGNVPQQLNGSDCGVFTVICADFLSDDLPLSYSQNDMQFFRRKIAADIVRGSLLYPV